MIDLNDPIQRLAGALSAVTLEERGPDYPTAHANLIDALRAFIRANECAAKDLLNEEAITPAQFKNGEAVMQPCRLLLEQLENNKFDPWLKRIVGGMT